MPPRYQVTWYLCLTTLDALSCYVDVGFVVNQSGEIICFGE